MPCLIGLIALAMPRLALVPVFLFSDFLGRAYHTALWPIVGFLFLPLTTLAYAAAINWKGSVSGGYFFMVLVAALIDLGIVGGGGWHRRRGRDMAARDY